MKAHRAKLPTLPDEERIEQLRKTPNDRAQERDAAVLTHEERLARSRSLREGAEQDAHAEIQRRINEAQADLDRQAALPGFQRASGGRSLDDALSDGGGGSPIDATVRCPHLRPASSSTDSLIRRMSQQ